MKPTFKTRLLMTAIMSVILYSILFLGSQTPLTRGEAQQLMEQLEQIAASIDSPFFIFFNNFGLSLLMALPFAGILVGGWVIYETGRYFSAMAMIYEISPTILIFLPIIMVYGILEFIGYGGMVTSGLILSHKIIRRQFRVEIKYYLLTLLLFAVVILIAAIIEYYLIIVARDVLREVGGIL
ncbi:MAG: hypothetical protein QXO86_05765 [Nitrososphaerota archaeon]